MPELCANLDGETFCMDVDLTIFDDPRQGEVPEMPADPPGAVRTTGVGTVRTRVAQGAVPDGWPRDERIGAELVKGRERVPCELVIQTGDTADESQALELLIIGDEAFRAVMGRAP